MKKFALALVAVVIAGGVFLYMNFGSAAKRAIEEAGSRATGTSVSVGGLDASIANKSASLSKLSVKNPKGFKESYLLETKNVSVTLADVSQQAVTISDVTVDGMTVTYELGTGGSNLDAIEKNIQAATASAAGAAPGGGGKSDNIKVIIRKLHIIHAEVIPAIGAAHAPVPLPDITLTDLGSASHPATPSQVAGEVMRKIVAVSSSGALKAGLGNLQGAAGSAVNGAVKGVTSAQGSVKSGIKGLFGK